MKLSGLHLLLTYQCTFECDHCFVFGSPFQAGVMTLSSIRHILDEAQTCPSVNSIYFEGGEPFLYYPVLLQGVEEAHRRGFEVGIVSNAYWATSVEDARQWLKPLAGKISDLSVSSDLYHYSEQTSQQSRNAAQAAGELGIPLGVITIAGSGECPPAPGQLPPGESGVMYRGRAADKLAVKVPWHAWEGFTTCPFEDLVEPGRVHVDPFGNLHICQGIVIGNLFQQPLRSICDEYQPEAHPVVSRLLAGGPAALARNCQPALEGEYADACHLCFSARRLLRDAYPSVLAPDQMYGQMMT
jgi:MoaA/NifB/PqqE/SkfB family radical SAM enzyme